MASIMKAPGFYILFCFSFVCSAFSDDICVQKSPCMCEFYNGTGINLSASAGSTFYTTKVYSFNNDGTKYELSTYYYHPCHDMVPIWNSTDPGDTCKGPVMLCRQVNMMEKIDNKTTNFQLNSRPYEKMGSSNKSEFSHDGGSIIYFNGPSSTVVLLVCAETDDQLAVYSLAEPKKIVLAFYSKNACLQQIEEFGRSFGSTLLIIFFSFVIFYLVLGVCTKKFLMGATGLEVVPNLTFWMDLPNLVKDGWAYARNGFKLPERSPGAAPSTSKDPNSYDSI